MGAPQDNNFGPNRLLDAKQLASILNVSPAWIYDQSRRGRLPTVTLGRYRRYRWASVEQWISEQEAPMGARAGGNR